MDLSCYKELVYQIVGASFEVYNNLGFGLAEAIYNEALHLELIDNDIPNQSEVYLPCYYKEHKLEKSYRMDLVVGDIIVEIKSTYDIISEHRGQLFNYLRLTKKPIGLLINFGEKRLHVERFGYFADRNECLLLDKDLNPRKLL